MAPAVTALAGRSPVRAILVDASLNDVEAPWRDESGAPATGAVQWLAYLGLDGARGLASSTQHRQVTAADGQLAPEF